MQPSSTHESTIRYAAPLSADALLSLGCMEGMFDHIVAPAGPEAKPVAPRALHVPGYALVASVTALAYGIHYFPLGPFRIISTAILAILVGLVVRNALPLPDSIRPGCKRVVKKGIPIAIVLTGAGLNLTHVGAIGFRAFSIVIVCVVVALAAGYYLGRLVGLSSRTSWLLGVGTGICGNSAIVAVAPLIDAEDEDLVLSVSTINLFGLLAMLAWPLIGGWLALSDPRFGVWSGTSIHAVPQVVAAGFAHSAGAGTLATLVKLVRVALLAPLVFALAVVHARHQLPGSASSGRLTIHYARLVPWFVWGFIALAAMNTLGLIPTVNFEPAGFLSGTTHDVSVPVGGILKLGGKLLLTLAMAAIGLEVNLRQLAGVGGRALLAGLFATIVLGAVSLALTTFLI